MASAIWAMTQHRDPGSCSFSSLPTLQLYSLAFGLKLHRLGHSILVDWTIASLQFAIWRKVLCLRRWLLQYGEWFRTGILVADPIALSAELPTLDSAHVSLVHPALLLPKSRVNDYNKNFVHCPLKKLSVCLPISLWQRPHCFSQLDVICVPFQVLVL